MSTKFGLETRALTKNPWTRRHPAQERLLNGSHPNTPTMRPASKSARRRRTTREVKGEVKGDITARLLDARLADLHRTLERIRLLEALVLEINKTLSVDQSITPDIHHYKSFRFGLVPLEVLANLARYEAHIADEIKAMLMIMKGADPP